MFATGFETDHLSSFSLEPKQTTCFGCPGAVCLSVCAGPPAVTPQTCRGPSGPAHEETLAFFHQCPAFVVGRSSICICPTARSAIRPFLSLKAGPLADFGPACCSRQLFPAFQKSVLALNFVDFPALTCCFEMKDYFHSLSFLRIN